MKKAKISDAELRMILILLALLLLAASYFFGYNRLMNEAAAQETQNNTDRTTVSQLESMVGRQAQVEQETIDLRQHILDVIAKYPSNLTTEKAIYIVQNMEDYSTVHIYNISFLMRTLLMNFSVANEATNIPPTGYYATLSMSYAATYDGLKNMIGFINSMEDRTTITAISSTYDQESDMLTGVMTINMYYLTDTGREYEEPDVGYHEKGVESIFGAGYGLGSEDELAGEGAEEGGEGGEPAAAE